MSLRFQYIVTTEHASSLDSPSMLEEQLNHLVADQQCTILPLPKTEAGYPLSKVTGDSLCI